MPVLFRERQKTFRRDYSLDKESFPYEEKKRSFETRNPLEG